MSDLDSQECPEDRFAYEHTTELQAHLEILYLQSFSEAALYADVLQSLRRAQIQSRARLNEVAELERWYALSSESDGSESANHRPLTDTGTS